MNLNDIFSMSSDESHMIAGRKDIPALPLYRRGKGSEQRELLTDTVFSFTGLTALKEFVKDMRLEKQGPISLSKDSTFPRFVLPAQPEKLGRLGWLNLKTEEPVGWACKKSKEIDDPKIRSSVKIPSHFDPLTEKSSALFRWNIVLKHTAIGQITKDRPTNLKTKVISSSIVKYLINLLELKEEFDKTNELEASRYREICEIRDIALKHRTSIPEDAEFLLEKCNQLLKAHYEKELLTNFWGKRVPPDKLIEYGSLMYLVKNIEKDKSLSELRAEGYEIACEIIDFRDKAVRALGIK